MSSIRAEEPAETPKKNNRISDEDTLKFLTLCIKHSDICKINWEAVVDESGIVSKGAAAKRYERLLKRDGASPASKVATKKRRAADINDNDNDDNTSAVSPAKDDKKATGKKKGIAKPAPKKRKTTANASTGNEDADTIVTQKAQDVAGDGDVLGGFKSEGSAHSKESDVKAENGADGDISSSAEI